MKASARLIGLASLSIARDMHNLARFGTAAPRFAERIWIDPRRVRRVSFDASLRPLQSARVIGGDWDNQAEGVGEWEKFAACQQHWLNGISWEDTGIIASREAQIARQGPKRGMRGRSDVVERYRQLDAIYTTVATTKELSSTTELGRHIFRGWGEMLIHIGRGPELILGRGGGQHRFAMANSLELDVVPAQLGVIHPESIDGWDMLVMRSQTRPQSA